MASLESYQPEQTSVENPFLRKQPVRDQTHFALANENPEEIQIQVNEKRPTSKPQVPVVEEHQREANARASAA